MADASSAAASIVAAIRNLDIRKVAAVIVTLAAIAHTISVGELKLDGMIPASWIPHVIAYANAFVIVAPFLVAGHSFSALKWPDLPPKMLAALFAIGAAAAVVSFGVTPADALERAKPAAPVALPCDPLKLLPGCRQTDGSIFSGLTNAASSGANSLAAPFQAIADLVQSDNAGAIALATQIADLQDGNGQQCWMAMKSFSEVYKAHPVPVTLKVQTDVEAFRLLVMAANKLCGNSYCRVVFTDLSNAVESAGALSVPVPSLTSLCSKVPQFAVVAPVNIAPASVGTTQSTAPTPSTSTTPAPATQSPSTSTPATPQ